MAKQLNGKYLGSYGGSFKFEDDSFRTIVFTKCSSDLIKKFELQSEKHINKLFRIGFIYFDKQDVKIINDLIIYKSNY